MKKKLALMLASVMTLSTLMMPAQVSAAVKVEVRGSYNPVVNKTVAFEPGILTYGERVDYNNLGEISYAIDGQNLLITLDAGYPVNVGDTFEVILSGAKWFFRNRVDQTAAPMTANQAITLPLSQNIATGFLASGSSVVTNGVNALNTVATVDIKAVPDTDYAKSTANAAGSGLTYIKENGMFINQAGAAVGSGFGTYYRYQNYASTNNLWIDEVISQNRAKFGEPLTSINDGGTTKWAYANNYLGKVLLNNPGTIATVNTTVVGGTTYYTQGTLDGAISATAIAYATTNLPTALAAAGHSFQATQAPATSRIVEVPYRLDIGPGSVNATSATVTILPMRDSDGSVLFSTYAAPGTSNNTYTITIPLSYKATGNEVTVTIPQNRSFGNGINLPATPLGTTEASRGVSIYSVDSSVTGRDKLELKEISIKENIGNIIQSGGVIELKAPAGYKFDLAAPTNIKVGVEHNLYWASSNQAETSKLGVAGTDYSVSFKSFNYTSQLTQDYQTVYIRIPEGSITRSFINAPGRIWLEGIVLVADYAALFEDVYLSVRTLETPTSVALDKGGLNLLDTFGIASFTAFGRTDLGIGKTAVSVKVGTRKDWTITFAPVDPEKIPTLVAGRYSPGLNDQGMSVDISQTNAGDDHKASAVKLTENAVNAWWASRETMFTLPDGVKFRKVQITADPSNVNTPANGTNIIANGEKTATYVLESNRFSLYSLTITANKTANFTFTPYISIAADYPGETVSLTFTNNTVSTVTNESKQDALIANVVKPATVKVDTITELTIGLQTIKTSNVTIEETAAGRLQRGKEIKVSVTDMITQDLFFAPIDAARDVVATSANNVFALRDIKNLDTNTTSVNNSSALLMGLNSGTISMTVDRESITTPATITLSNLQVKVNREVPQSTDIEYSVVVWGSAIASNYGTARDMFNSPGIIEKYARVVTASNDIAVLSQEVRITIGEAYYLVNGNPRDISDPGAVAYVSADGATMVPLRFVSEAFGLDASQILWDDSTKTATIIHPSKVLQFTAGSDRMLISGSPITMGLQGTDGNYYVYKAEITNDRLQPQPQSYYKPPSTSYPTPSTIPKPF